MADGLPCIATDVGGPREIIRRGENGLLVPPGDAKALAEAIRLLWGDAELRTRLGRAAAVDVRERFGADRVVDEVEHVYERLLARGHGHGRS